MFQTDEMVNDLLKYSKILVDEIDNKKGLSYNLHIKSKQYLIFAGMLSYYGLDSVSSIYDAFKAMNFQFTKLSAEDFLRSHYSDISADRLAQARNSCRAFVKRDCVHNHLGQEEMNYDLVVCIDGSLNSCQLLEITAHEVNHIVNSINKKIIKINGKDYLRTGMSLVAVDGKYTNVIFEEAINVLQTYEILEEIINFSYFKIDDPVIFSALENISYAQNIKAEPRGYPSIVPEVRPLFQNPMLYHTFKECRKEGNILTISEKINNMAQEDIFNDLAQSLDNMFYSHSQTQFYINQAKTRNLVQKVLRR